MLPKIINFLKTDIWRIQLKNCPRRKSFFLRLLRIIVLSVRGFTKDKCKFRASALTFFTVLSIVPMIAMFFGVAKGFGFAEDAKAELRKKMNVQLFANVAETETQKQDEQPNVADKIIEFSDKMLEKTHSASIVGAGILVLLWTVISVLGNIENSFNDIWGIKRPRSFIRKLGDYLLIVLTCPFLMVLSSSLTVTISSKIMHIIQSFPIFKSIGPLVAITLNLLPYVSLWVVFSFLFIAMPNTKVKFKSGLLAGIVAGTIFQITQMLYIKFQIVVANYNVVYGSFAAFPLFLTWLQTSWFIVLFGAEISFAHQNVDTYEFEQESMSASGSLKKMVALLVTQLIVKRFCNGQLPWDDMQISQALDVPIRLVRQVLYDLTKAGVVCAIKTDSDKDIAYQPGVDTDKLTVKYVIESLEMTGISDIPIEKTNQFEKLSQYLKTIAMDIEKSPANILLKTI